MTHATDVIRQAERWVGFVEGRGNRSPFGKWYGMDGQPYCAMAVSMWSHDAGLPVPASTSKGYAYTPSGAAWFKKHGRWGTTPRVGAHVFFRFSGNRIHHVGLVTGVNSDGSIDTIEANTSRGSGGSQRDGGGVWRRRRKAGIVGYGYPDYSGGAASAPPPAPAQAQPASAQWTEEVLRVLPIVKRGSKGQHARNVQALLNANGERVAIDGDFGPGSDRALRAWQGRAGLAADGECGPNTWRRLLSA